MRNLTILQAIFGKLACIFTIISISFFALNIQGQQTVVNYPDAFYDRGFDISSQSSEGVTITFSIDQFTLTDKLINGDNLKTIQLPGNFLPNNFGAPDLPGSGKYIAIPAGASAKLKINNIRTESFTNIDIAPAPRIPKVTEVGPLDYQKDMSIYSQNVFYPVKPVSLSSPQKIRGVDVVLLGITPFQYNPVTKELIVYRDIEVEIEFNGGNGQFGDNRLRSRWWDPILKDALFNSSSLPTITYSSNNSKIQSDTSNFEYIIICPDDPIFIQWADTIRIWRTRQGIISGVMPLSTIGGNNANVIESFIDHAYNNWTIPPSAILFLGDYGTSGNNSIISPEWNNYCISDNLYADVDGDDLPDISTARITARDTAELAHMIGKFLSYERNPPTNQAFYDNPVTAMGWQTERWFQLCSEIINGFWEYGLGKNPVRENAIYSGTPGGTWSTNANTQIIVDYFGPTGLGYIPDNTAHLTDWGGDATRINNDINSGAFMLQHRDHGGVTGWGEPDYSNSDLAGLTNNDLVYVFSINCLTGKFNDGNECFAEAFHRHQYGALGIMAATEVSYSFVNDTYVWGMFDDMWPEFMPAYGAPPTHSDNILPAFANSAAKYFLQQSSWPFNPQNKEVTYYLFHHHGDAFSTVYSEMPQYLTVVHDPILYSGVNFFTVTADTGALISLTVNDEIIGLDYGTGGPLNIPIIAQMPGNNMLVTITKQNYYRYEQYVPIIPPVGPFVVYSNHIIDDTAGGNANGMVEFNETLDLSIAMLNLGVQAAINVNVTISTSDTNVMIIDSTEFYGNINAGDTLLITDGFSFYVDPIIPDNHTILFEVKAIGDSTWNSTFTQKIYAPVMKINNMVISDPAGNNNGRLDPGETVDVIIDVENVGHSDAINTTGMLSSTHPDITINTLIYNLDTIAPGDSKNATHSITVDPSSTKGTVVDLTYFTYSGSYADQKTFFPSVGLIVEDWETGDFTNYNWEFAETPWVIDSNNQYEGSYCSRSGNIGNNSSSILYITLEVLANDTISFFRKVSSESGYDFLKFYIDNVLQDQWAGELPWARVSFPVAPGLHTFKWEYNKDWYMTSGDDCAWVDFIEFPHIPALDAGLITLYNIPGQSGIHDINVDLKNFGLDILTSVTIDWEVDGNAGISYTWTGNLPKDGIQGPVTIGSYNFVDGWHTIKAWTTNPNGGIDQFNFNDTIEADMYFISPVSNFPYCESFETDIGYWQQPVDDDFDWTRNSGGTYSNGTGPSSAYDGSFYMYTESSNPRVDGDEAFFILECDFSLLNNPELSFYYHMYGNGMGTLHIDVFDSTWQNDVWSLSGDQTNNWFQAVVDMSAYSNKPYIVIRFRGEVGNGVGNTYRSDMAIDLVCVQEQIPVYCIPSSNCQVGDGIDDFSLNTIVHIASGCSPGGYGDFTNMQTDLIAGGSYPMSVSSNFGDQYLSVWIDLNDNAVFDIVERLITDMLLPYANTTFTDTLNIPGNANTGLHRMRVRTRWDSTCLDPCIAYVYGETHDYMVNIMPDTNLIVNITPDTSICQGDNVTLNADAIGSGTPFSYLWNNGSTTSSIIVNPLNTTTYTVTVTDFNGITAIDDAIVNVFPLPQISSHPLNASVKQGADTSFIVQVNGNNTYKWQVSMDNGNTWNDLANNATYSGVNTNLLLLTNTLLSMDDYQYKCVITNTNNCSVESNIAILNVIQVPPIVTQALSYNGCLGNVIIPITATNFNDVASFNLLINYNDTTHLTYLNQQNVHVALGCVTVNVSKAQMNITWNSPNNVTIGNDTLFELVFNAMLGTSSLDFDIALSNYHDFSGYTYPDSYINGTINSYSCSNISGRFYYPNQDSTPLNNTTVYAYNIAGYNQDSTITDVSGDYSISSLPLDSYSIIANIDKIWGGVNANDALVIMMHFAGMTNLTGLQLEVADVDMSGFVNTLDALMCAQRFVGMIYSFPAGDWAHDIDTLLIDGTAPVFYNFEGLCYGDVNRSFIPSTVRTEPLLTLDRSGTKEIIPNDIINIPLSVNKDMDINAVSLIFDFPAEHLEFKGVVFNNDQGVLQYNEKDGEIRISWYSTKSLEIKESEMLLELVFSPLFNDVEGLNKVYLNLHPQSELADEMANTIRSAKLLMPDLVSSVDGMPESYLGQNYPNPFNDFTEIEYVLLNDGKVSIEIYNTLGEKVDVIYGKKMHKSGSYKVKYDPSNLSPGIYYYKMILESDEGSFISTKIMIRTR